MTSGEFTGRQRGAASALVLGMLDRAISAQRDGGESVQVNVTIDADTAKVIGVAGEGDISLRLWPCKPVPPGGQP